MQKYRIPERLSEDTKILITMDKVMDYMKDKPFNYQSMNLQDFWNYLQFSLSEKTQKDL